LESEYSDLNRDPDLLPPLSCFLLDATRATRVARVKVSAGLTAKSLEHLTFPLALPKARLEVGTSQRSKSQTSGGNLANEPAHQRKRAKHSLGTIGFSKPAWA
jgi:hypothetical protein